MLTPNQPEFFFGVEGFFDRTLARGPGFESEWGQRSLVMELVSALFPLKVSSQQNELRWPVGATVHKNINYAWATD